MMFCQTCIEKHWVWNSEFQWIVHKWSRGHMIESLLHSLHLISRVSRTQMKHKDQHQWSLTSMHWQSPCMLVKKSLMSIFMLHLSSAHQWNQLKCMQKCFDHASSRSFVNFRFRHLFTNDLDDTWSKHFCMLCKWLLMSTEFTSTRPCKINDFSMSIWSRSLILHSMTD